jgi:hypothetical protein
MLANFLQLDRSSLFLQISRGLPSDLAIRTDELNEFLNGALMAGDRSAAQGLRLKGDETDVDLLLLASCLWHEKRHFIDLVLTTYGSAVFRQVLEVQFNLPSLLARHSQRKLVVPLRTYTDRTRLKIVGATDSAAIDETFMAFIRAIERRRKRFLSDNSAIKIGGDSIELSGTSFLETIAFLSQTAGIREFFSEDLSLAAQTRLQNLFGKLLPYTWLLHFSTALEMRADVPPRSSVVTYADALVPLLYASLCGRTWLKDGPANYQSLPVSRFWAILEHLRSTGETLAGCSVEEAFQLVDQATGELWSESIASSLAESLTWEGEQLKVFESHVSDELQEIPLRVWRDYLRLRRLAVEHFQQAPMAFLDPVRFAPELLGHLEPLTMIVVEKGSTSAPPDGVDLVWHDERVVRSAEGERSMKVWWSYLVGKAIERNDWALRPRDEKAWVEYYTLFVSVSRLLLEGRLWADAKGPDMEFAEGLLRGKLGLDLIFDPLYGYPDAEINAGLFRLFFGNGRLCDVTERRLEPETAVFLSPVVIHMSPHNKDFMRKHIPGLLLGREQSWFSISAEWDWSGWIVHKEVLANLKGFGLRRSG